MKKLIVEKPQDLKSFLAEKLNISKKKAKQIIDTKNVFVNSKRIWIATHFLKVGDLVELPYVEDSNTFGFKLSKSHILYEDEYIIAINKPPFYISESKSGSIEDFLRKNISKSIRAIHRLDFETSGVILFAKNNYVFEKFKKLWEEKKIKKIYLAISHNKANFTKKVISFKIDGKPAKSTVFTLKTSKNYTLFKIDIKTGRKHQIRIHLAKIGYPIVGDKVYGFKLIKDPILKNVKRHMLHAYILEFYHPFFDKKLLLKAPLFEDFKFLEKKLNLS